VTEEVLPVDSTIEPSQPLVVAAAETLPPPEAVEAEPPATAVVPATMARPAAPRTAVTLLSMAGKLVERLRTAGTEVVPYTYYQIRRIGSAGVVGAAATLAAIAIGLTALIGIRGATESLTAEIARAAHPSAAAPSDGLGRVVAQLPTRAQMPAVVGLVLEQARAANVALPIGHYAYSPPKSGGVGRYEMEFPVKADYPSVRNFINRTLTAVPSAGLDKLRIERKVVGDTVVSADIRFVVFVRSEP
jgi:hypothetical protein